jgi:cell division protein FtsI (penicillin-binding protein 3)
MDNPKYAMIVVIDEPKRENPQTGDTAGWNAGEITGRIVQQAAPMLGIAPDYSAMLDNELTPVELR